MCVLALIIWGYAPDVGFYNACFYDCNVRDRNRYDFIRRIPIQSSCAATLRFV